MFRLDARLTTLSSSDLLAALDRVAADGRDLTADLIALLAVCDARKLYATEGYESLFEFCVRRLRLSESQAYHRIQAARAARDFPLVLERLRAGRVTMTAVALLRDHLTEANHVEVLDWAEGRRKREVELFIRTLDPKPDVPPSLRRLAAPGEAPAVAAERNPAHSPETTRVPSTPPDDATSLFEPVATSPATMAQAAAAASVGASPCEAVLAAPQPVGNTPVRRAEIHPLSPARYSLHVTISRETHDKLRRAEDLLGHAGSRDFALVLDRALTLLVAQLERKKAGAPRRRLAKAPGAPGATSARPAETRGKDAGSEPAVRASGGGAVETSKSRDPLPETQPSAAVPSKPRVPSRYIPAAVRRAVWDRDGASCAYVSRRGVRCGATSALEFHHRVPFAEGGEATVANLEMRCKRHNQAEAERWFNSDQSEFGSKRSKNPRVFSPLTQGGGGIDGPGRLELGRSIDSKAPASNDLAARDRALASCPSARTFAGSTLAGGAAASSATISSSCR